MSKRQLVGTVSFVLPFALRTLDTSPVYAGEDPHGPEVLARAKRAFSMLRDARFDPRVEVLSRCFRVYHPSGA